jgi:hypothetical protein
MEIMDSMDIWTPEKYKYPNQNTGNGRIGSIGNETLEPPTKASVSHRQPARKGYD